MCFSIDTTLPQRSVPLIFCAHQLKRNSRAPCDADTELICTAGRATGEFVREVTSDLLRSSAPSATAPRWLPLLQHYEKISPHWSHSRPLRVLPKDRGRGRGRRRSTVMLHGSDGRRRRRCSDDVLYTVRICPDRNFGTHFRVGISKWRIKRYSIPPTRTLHL